MQLPSPQVDTEFAQFLQALPADGEAMMRERGALTYAGQIPTPEELLRAILLYCGPDQSLREVVGTLTLRAERITDQAVWKRLHRWTPFLIALLKQLLPHQLPLYEPQEKSRARDFCAALQRQKPGTMGSLPVVLQYAETSKKKEKRELCGSLHVYRMTAKEAKEASQRVRRTHHKKQRKLSEKTRFLRQCVLVLTS